MSREPWEENLSSSLSDSLEGDGIRAAVALLVVGNEPEIAFIQRSHHPNDPWSGHIALPGGRRDPVDVDLIATAIRETIEEIGVVLPRAALLGALPQVQAKTRRGPEPFWVAPFVFRLPERPATALNHEVAALHWLSVAALRDPSRQTVFPWQAADGIRYDFPGIRVADQVLWGLTWKIIQTFLERVS